ncbi:MAG: hypothetical protein IKZ88_01485 [Neisseriaceae bacterium]|nr:hypothetical protein [Neisseriaceae bacterium]
MLNKLILSIFLCFGLTSVYAEEVDNKKMREAVRRVLQFVNADYYVYSTSTEDFQFDKNKEFSDLISIMNTYKLNKNVWYLGKVNTEDNGSAKECYDNNQEKSDYEKDACVDAFAVEFVYNPCSGSACGFQELWLSSSFAHRPEYGIKMNYDNSLSNDFYGKYFDVKQIKKAPYPEFIITSYALDENDSPNFPTLKYQQKFRFNNETIKFEQIGKEKLVGKIQYCHNERIPVSQKCKD